MQRSFMSLALGVVPALLLLCGCESPSNRPVTNTDSALFGAAAMRIHPIFTQVKDWTGDGRPDGIEALIELQDQFGDPTKASGRVIFELFSYRAYDPDHRGERLVNPWIGDLSTLEAQRDRWNRTSRTYGFQLQYDQIREEQTYVLTATFELSNGGRFFDQIVLAPKPPPTTFPTTLPTTRPSTAPATAPAAAASGG
jgi:hypothetical protein